MLVKIDKKKETMNAQIRPEYQALFEKLLYEEYIASRRILKITGTRQQAINDFICTFRMEAEKRKLHFSFIEDPDEPMTYYVKLRPTPLTKRIKEATQQTSKTSDGTIKYEIIKSLSYPKGLNAYNRYKRHVESWLVSDDPELVILTEDDAGGKAAYRGITSILENRKILHMVVGTRSHEKAMFRKLPNFDYTENLFTNK